MVQIHQILVPGLPVIFTKERHALAMLDEALVKPSGSSVYVKWQSCLLWKKKKAIPCNN